MIFLGLDGGGTKTHCLISDENGKLLGEGLAGPSNHQVVGAEASGLAYQKAVEMALLAAGIKMSSVTCAAFGLSGADEPIDFEILEPICQKIVGEVPFTVVNDSWIGLLSGADHGVVAICGTGSAHAGITKDGQRYILRNLNYLTGNYGGGGAILEQSLHYAFRSYEGTYHKSRLEEGIMDLAGASDMDGLSDLIRDGDIPPKLAYGIPILTAKLAHEGDEVAIEILSSMGQELGRFTSAVIEKLEMTQEDVPLVLIGSVFKARVPELMESYLKQVRLVAQRAVPVIPDKAPVWGALVLAMDHYKRLIALS